MNTKLVNLFTEVDVGGNGAFGKCQDFRNSISTTSSVLRLKFKPFSLAAQ